jgi:L-cystine uptake protein TcyP (sodium:dicarboxylate symporter family)
MIPRLNNQGLIERMAIVSLLILVVNIIMKAIIGILKKDRWGYSAKKNTRKTKKVKVKI